MGRLNNSTSSITCSAGAKEALSKKTETGLAPGMNLLGLVALSCLYRVGRFYPRCARSWQALVLLVKRAVLCSDR